eukprot:CAMPEP_0194196916 /NCGR_PEP_ID=MMETSP0154-20130528/76927_1 /TAXON_ID=1049557 /ORGANISM="Thalassiothrix antarctica, Strain L6-D1" /LENGTH=271 /DNA_ID=CAMNT_0038921549 /DNA_START=289 /DNA_END=1101 /DNA_ORIENTATION=+
MKTKNMKEKMRASTKIIASLIIHNTKDETKKKKKVRDIKKSTTTTTTTTTSRLSVVNNFLRESSKMSCSFFNKSGQKHVTKKEKNDRIRRVSLSPNVSMASTIPSSGNYNRNIFESNFKALLTTTEDEESLTEYYNNSQYKNITNVIFLRDDENNEDELMGRTIMINNNFDKNNNSFSPRSFASNISDNDLDDLIIIEGDDDYSIRDMHSLMEMEEEDKENLTFLTDCSSLSSTPFNQSRQQRRRQLQEAKTPIKANTNTIAKTSTKSNNK